VRAGLIFLLLSLVPLAAWGVEGRLIADFESDDLSGWEEKPFKGHTAYRIITEGDGHCLEARSDASASGYIYRLDVDLHQTPRLTWRWKVDRVLDKGDARSKAGDDYPARVYVIFPHWFPPKTRSLNYIWANRLPQGEAIPNSYYAKAIMVAVESGPDKAGAWVAEERNVLEDFRRLFGEEPPRVGAIAIMTDTDNTGERATACYDDIRLLP